MDPEKTLPTLLKLPAGIVQKLFPIPGAGIAMFPTNPIGMDRNFN